MSRRTSARQPGHRRLTASHGLASSGFSVLEMIVTVAIVGLVAMVGMPALFNQLSKVRLEAAATDVANLIQQTRLRAIRDGQQYTVEVDGVDVTGQTIVGSNESDPFEMEFYNPPIAVYPVDDPGIADCQEGGIWGGPSITYDSTGAAQDTGAICVWDGGENILQVVIEFPAGPPKIRKFLKTGDGPAGQGFYEKTSAATSGSTWSWY